MKIIERGEGRDFKAALEQLGKCTEQKLKFVGHQYKCINCKSIFEIEKFDVSKIELNKYPLFEEKVIECLVCGAGNLLERTVGEDIIKANEQMTILKSEYKQLIKDQAKLEALEKGGVDNWAWYNESLEEWREKYDE